MNSEIFTGWVQNQLIPALTFDGYKTVIIMDNAPYHSVRLEKPPTRSSNKSYMQDYLKNIDIFFEPNYTKKQLWSLIEPTLPNNPVKYEIDTICYNSGIDVLRLPPYHCEYNPIELAWSFCKQYYNKNINMETNDPERTLHLWAEAIANFTPEMWQNCIQNCEKLIEDDWHKAMGNFSVEDIPPIIISLADDSGSDISDEETDVDDIENHNTPCTSSS
ncbi:hypothetical protein Zmor_010262 [Zophobas morio]|uniref:Tc1-like transposase DDE domain-containing protein n=1 Tax=Zophobas morio TaxID=2755281 RepID=A0AA38IIQ6_9CUCU|nr:hypothetical protein Zmor_010262 [Zophobas morio]